MISYLNTFFGVNAEACSSLIFDVLLDDKTTAERCSRYQRLKKEYMELTESGRTEDAKALDDEIDTLKRSHPVLCYLGTYRNGVRKSDNLEPNGLYFIDIDLQDNPELLKDGPLALDERIREQDVDFYNENIVLAHVSWSGTGLRYVVKADHSMTYVENCNAFAEKYGIAKDEHCKDLARCSFVPTRDLVIKLSDELFTYHKPLTNAEFGGSNDDTSVKLWYDRNEQSSASTQSVKPASGARGQGCMKDVQRDADGEPLYRYGVRYRDLARKLMNVLGGVPRMGDRNNRVLEWGKHFRSICDNDVEFMLSMVHDLAGGLSDDEIRKALQQSLKYGFVGRTEVMSKLIGENRSTTASDDLLDIEYWADGLDEMRMPKGIRETLLGVPRRLRPGAILAILPCIYTLLSRVEAVYCNGKVIRLNGMTLWVGDSTIGKSYLKEICGKWMNKLMKQDAVYRTREAEYKRQRDKANGSKSMKEERPQFPIRLTPSNISTSMLVTRLDNARVMVPTLLEDGSEGPCKEMNLHLMTIEPDMVSMELAQKHHYSNYLSYVLKSFDNDEAGQDYKNDASTNGIIPVCWNQSWAGTWTSFNKLVKQNVGTGLENRLMIFPAPSDHFQKEEKSKFFEHPEWTQTIEDVSEMISPFWGTIYSSNLINAMNNWCDEIMNKASQENDAILDTFRKRDRMKGFCAALAYSLLEKGDSFFKLPVRKLKNGMVVRDLKVSKNAINFGRYVADLCIAGEMATLKELVKQRQEQDKQSLLRVVNGVKKHQEEMMQLYNGLKEKFTKQDLMNKFPETKNETIKSWLKRWKREGLITFDPKTHVYTKQQMMMM